MRTSTLNLGVGIFSLGISAPLTYMSGNVFFDILEQRDGVEARMQEIAAERDFLEAEIYDCLNTDSNQCQALSFRYEVLNQEYNSLEKELSSSRFTLPLSGLGSLASLGLGAAGIYFLSQYPSQRRKEKKKEEDERECTKELENLLKRLDERIKAESNLKGVAYKAGAKKE